MSRILFSFSLLIFLPLVSVAQKSVSHLQPAHATALQRFLSKHPDLDFMSENDCVCGYKACVKVIYSDSMIDNSCYLFHVNKSILSVSKS